MSILQRIEGERFSEVLRHWIGETVVLLGGGPSLSLEQVEHVNQAHTAGKCKCIAVNDAYLWAPWAEVQYAADAKWHAWQISGTSKPSLWLTAAQVRDRWASYPGEKCSIQSASAKIDDEKVHILRNAHFPNHGLGLSLDPRALITGRNSGFQALNLAILAGAVRVLLLGYDGAPSKDGKTHWFGDHPTISSATVYAAYRESFSAAERAIKAAGVEVINCSPGSMIDTFPKRPLTDVL